MQDSLLSQKANIQWFEEGERNTQFFHSKLREKRRRLQLNRIKKHKGNWVQGEEKIAKAAIRHFNSNFNLPTPTLDLSILNCISTKITQENRDSLDKEPNMDETRHATFSLSATSASGPDGYNGIFFHTCWDIIKDDINDLVWDFFKGTPLTKLISANQSGFVKDKLISENVLLAQEIVQYITINNNGGNFVLKLDMA
ncbi:uncharacterized protein [Nicotiana tomentosiformis]|uniref:uncharacterized protein n=1 Tax=Nicotiana tomentosiformis TaxID=4098 RepID=UPI00388CE55C